MSRKFTRWVRCYPLVAYFVLVFGIEWLLVLTLPLLVPPLIVLLIGSWLPNAVGLFVTGLAGGRAGLRELLGKVTLWRIAPRWYAITLLLPIAIVFLASGLYSLSGEPLPDVASASQLLPIAAAALLTGALGEELGWRGTALPRLQARWNALASSLILGGLWGLYHLPSFLLAGLPLQATPFIPFMVACLGLTALVTWTFNHTNGSLIPAFLYHFSFNFILNAAGITGAPALFTWVAATTGVVAIAAIALDRVRFSRLATKLTEGVWTIG